MREEYTEYPCSGKKYNGEKAIISLTSWKARINTVSKTLYSLIKQCPGFHIVLVLSEEEFPLKEKELPNNLMMFINNELIELLWVYKNYKSFKKVLFTMDKYRNVPVISADDDCLYTCNYAQELYDKWVIEKNALVSFKHPKKFEIDASWGCGTLYPPYYFKKYGIELLNDKILKTDLDDVYYIVLRKKLKLNKTLYINRTLNQGLRFINEKQPLHEIYLKGNILKNSEKTISNFMNNDYEQKVENSIISKDTIIVSLTSHSIRVKEVAKIAIWPIIKNTYKDTHIVLTLYKDDLKFIPEDLQLLIDNGIVELIIADKDLGPHLKYFYAMQKYRENIIITIDDDIIYPEKMIEEMVIAYKKYNCIIGRRCFEIKTKNGKLSSYNEWTKKYAITKKPVKNIIATGVGGILYPPNCLEISYENINEILKIKYEDDVYLKALEIRKQINIFSSFNGIDNKLNDNLLYKTSNNKEIYKIGLWRTKNSKIEDKNIALFEKEFIEAANG